MRAAYYASDNRGPLLEIEEGPVYEVYRRNGEGICISLPTLRGRTKVERITRREFRHLKRDRPVVALRMRANQERGAQ